MKCEGAYPTYPAYKDSGVEWLSRVPEHWEIKRLRFVAALNPSKSEARGLDRLTPVSFLPMEAIGDDGRLSLDQQKMIGEVESGYTYFREGDVTIAKITPCFENGKGAVMRNLLNGIGFGTTELIVARPLPGKTQSQYLQWLFNSSLFRKLGEGWMYGAGGQKRIPDDFVRDFCVAFPPIDEQGLVNTFLDRETAKIDELIAKQERLIALLNENRQAVISHAVTKGLDPTVPMKDSGVEWLGQVPAHWEHSPLKRSWSVTDCKHVTAEFVEEGIPLASIRDVQSWSVNLDNARQTTPSFYQLLIEGGRKPLPGDVIFSRNATVGETAKVTEAHPKFAMGQDVCLLHKLHPSSSTDFLLFIMRSQIVVAQLANFMIGSTFKRVNVEEIRSIVVALPPFEEQFAIADYLLTETARIDTLVNKANQSIDLMKERRAALISAAVTGKIDVREMG